MMFFPPLARQRLYTRPATYRSILRDIALGRVNRGADVALLEDEIRDRLGVPHALAVNQCRLGIYLAIKALVSAERRNVILSPFTIFDVVNMVVASGGRPVFADVDRGSCTIDAAEIERLIDDGTAAVLVTHTHVLAGQIDRIVDLCRSRGVALVEDAAVAFGTRHEGRPVGTLGDVGIYSFGLFKNVSAFFGGMVVAHQGELHSRMSEEVEAFRPISLGTLTQRMLYGLALDVSSHPLVFRALTYWVFRFGFLHGIEFINRRTRNDPDPVLRESLPGAYRQRMSGAQARLVRAQLSRVDRQLRERIATARFYHEALRDIPEILLPSMNPEGADGFLVFPIQVEEQAALLRDLARVGRDCAAYYYRNCADLACFAAFARDCPNARFAAGHVVLLPTYSGYSRREAEKNVAAIRAFFGRSA